MELTVKRFVRKWFAQTPAVVVGTILVAVFHTALFPFFWVFHDDVRISNLWETPIEFVKECY